MSNPTKIVLIGNYLPDRQESMLRFQNVLLEGLAARGLQAEVWQPEPRASRLIRNYRYGGFPKYLGYFDKFILFPRTLRRKRKQQPVGTVYHITDHGNAVYSRQFQRDPLAISCHDLLQIRSALGEFPQNPISTSGQKYQRWIFNSLRTARCAICISEKTRADFLRLTKLPTEAAHVVYNGLNYPYQPLSPEKARPLFAQALRRQTLTWPGDAASPFLFSISGAQWYKNRTGLLKIFALLRSRLPVPHAFVHVGPPFDAEQSALIAASGLRESLVHVPNLSNEELQAAYSLAAGLVFPSWEEGFGWPIAEAQACGCPVFTSNRAPMTEVGGDAACYFDPSDPAGAAESIVGGLALPGPLKEAGLRNARRWDPKLMLDAYQRIYDTLVLPRSNL